MGFSLMTHWLCIYGLICPPWLSQACYKWLSIMAFPVVHASMWKAITPGAPNLLIHLIVTIMHGTNGHLN